MNFSDCFLLALAIQTLAGKPNDSIIGTLGDLLFGTGLIWWAQQARK